MAGTIERVLLAYIDESGNTGQPANGGSLTYTLGCVLLDADDWPANFNELLDFRRRVREKFGIHMRAEIKANYLLRSNGDLRKYGLAPDARRIIYRAHLRELRRIQARAFAVVVDKRTNWRSTDVTFDLAWEGLLQRLERTSSSENATFMVIHDEGENDAVRSWVRRSRRYLTAGNAYGGGGTTNPARLLVDDPVPRQSQHSYLIQLADLIAYAAFRSVVAPSAALSVVCPQSTWTEIGPATHAAVNRLMPRAAPGIVVR